MLIGDDLPAFALEGKLLENHEVGCETECGSLPLDLGVNRPGGDCGFAGFAGAVVDRGSLSGGISSMIFDAALDAVR